MSDITSIAFALDPTNTPSFLLDWELTKLCNLDCSYCATGTDGGHDNTTSHPPLAECLASIDFMYAYVDEYMKYKRPTQRKVILNVYGGESLFHPDIVEILGACRAKYAQYKTRWHLTITCTTNAVVGPARWQQIVPLIDEFSLSYHAENLPKQHQQYLDNALYLKQHQRRFKCVVMMHNDPLMWERASTVIEFCKEHSLRYVAKTVDSAAEEWSYSPKQFSTLKTFWINQTPVSKQAEYTASLAHITTDEPVTSINEGRACCGGRKLSIDGDLKSCVSFVPKQGFTGWSCSVNWFFLFVRQVNGEVYFNKDCKMSTTGRVEPIGNLSDSQQIIDTLKHQLDTRSMPVVQCAKSICLCGFCAPKAAAREDFDKLIKRHVDSDVFLQQ